jgi:galactose mutarotase-like enzyme
VHEWTLAADEPGRLTGERRLEDLEGFPFGHRIEVEAVLRDRTLTLTTTLTATGEDPVPVCFGYHPYLTVPGVPRTQWEVDAPVRERLVLDERKLPTGEREPADPVRGPLGDRAFDDAFTVDPAGAEFRAGDVRVTFERGYPCAQIYAPPDDDVICFEPMTAPADALRRDPPAVAPGESYTARFSISV